MTLVGTNHDINIFLVIVELNLNYLNTYALDKNICYSNINSIVIYNSIDIIIHFLYKWTFGRKYIVKHNIWSLTI